MSTRSHIQSKNELIVLLCDQFQKGHGTVSPLKTLVVPSALISLFNSSRLLGTVSGRAKSCVREKTSHVL